MDDLKRARRSGQRGAKFLALTGCAGRVTVRGLGVKVGSAGALKIGKSERSAEPGVEAAEFRRARGGPSCGFRGCCRMAILRAFRVVGLIHLPQE
jgi:hypothetical protein